MGLRLHYRLLIWNLVLIALTVGTLYFVLNQSLRNLLEQQIERQLTQDTEVVAAYLTESRAYASPDAAADRLSGMLGVRVTVIALDGKVLGDSSLDGAALADVENHGSRPEVLEAKRQGVGLAIRLSGTTHQSYMYVARETDAGFVRLAKPLAQIQELEGDLRSLLLYASLIAVTLALFLSYLAGSRVYRPILEITQGAQRLAAGDLSRRLPVRGSYELVSLASSINTMAENLNVQMRELTDGKRRVEQILAAMTEGILVLDASGNVRLANASAASLLGARGELLGEKPPRILGNEVLNQAVQEVMRESRSHAVEVGTESGRTLYCHLCPVIGDAGQADAVVLVFHDLTEMRRTEKVRRDFVANVSHEFKTPLTSIRGYTETLLTDPIADAATRNEFLRVIERNARHLETLVRDLLVLAKLEAELPVTREEVDVHAIIQEFVSAREAIVAERGISVKVDCPQINLHADPSRLAAAISNLIDNAISYNRPGGEVRIRGYMEEGSFCLDVSDTGCGIPPEEIPRIFERFYRVDKARSRDSGGTGLGLSIAKHAVESQGGRILVNSRPGEGSTFSIRLQIPGVSLPLPNDVKTDVAAYRS